MVIDIVKLEKAIDKRHHAMERFYDIQAAAHDRDLNNNLKQLIELGCANEEDLQNAQEIIDKWY